MAHRIPKDNRVLNIVMSIILYVVIRHAIAEAKYRYCHGSLLATLVSSGNPLCMLANRINYEMDQYVIGLILLLNVRSKMFNFFGTNEINTNLRLKSS